MSDTWDSREFHGGMGDAGPYYIILQAGRAGVNEGCSCLEGSSLLTWAGLAWVASGGFASLISKRPLSPQRSRRKTLPHLHPSTSTYHRFFVSTRTAALPPRASPAFCKFSLVLFPGRRDAPQAPPSSIGELLCWCFHPAFSSEGQNGSARGLDWEGWAVTHRQHPAPRPARIYSFEDGFVRFGGSLC